MILPLALPLFALIAFFFWRDLRLRFDDIDIPDIIVENIEIKRVIDKDSWHLMAQRAEHKQGIIYGRSLDVKVTSENGELKTLTAESGIFSRESKNVTLEVVSGDITREDGDSIYLRAGRAYYDADADTWFLSKGVTLFDGTTEVSGPRGQIHVKDGISRISGGAKIIWNEQ